MKLVVMSVVVVSALVVGYRATAIEHRATSSQTSTTITTRESYGRQTTSSVFVRSHASVTSTRRSKAVVAVHDERCAAIDDDGMSLTICD